MACINRPFSKQSGSTCWFHAIMNGFVTSKYGQIIMYKAIAKFINEHVQTRAEYERFISPDLTCVRPGKLHSKFNFYKWFYHWLIVGVPVYKNSRNVMRNLVFTKRNVAVDNLGSYKGLTEILERMDIQDYAVVDIVTGNIARNNPDPSFVVFTSPYLLKNMPTGGFKNHMSLQVTFNGSTYRLDHASLMIFFERGGEHASHAITGLRCMNTGLPMIADSNSDTLYPCDWTNPSNIERCEPYVADCLTLYQSAPTGCHIGFVIYTNVRMSLYNFNRNVNNIKPNKILNRAMNTNG